jgi:acetoin utilization protein AcuC
MLLVFGPRSTDYDFGPEHPLTPRRFGPSIDLLRAVGAEPGLAPEPAPDSDLLLCHTREYIDVVRRFSYDPFGFAEAGIGLPDTPAFGGMHEAGAMVAGGSLRAVEAVLRGDEEHAFHPGGGLHHAMADRASGFCIYDDVALAIARARRDGLRVMYIDLDVHHGDGVQAIHWADPGVLTFSIHETGRTLFPWNLDGDASMVGEGTAAGSVVNVPLLPGTGEGAWVAALESLLPELAATFGPDLIVSQHGADSHAWDPLAHLAVTTTAHGRAARLVDRLAHRHAGGRWLATGGGGYDAYRVVPRTWTLTWLAGAHREVPTTTPPAWRERWSAEAARFWQAPLPETFDDEPDAGLDLGSSGAAAEAGSAGMAALVRRVLVPRLLREARDRGWWDPLGEPVSVAGDAVGGAARGAPTVLARVEPDTWSRLTLAPWVVPPAAPADGHALVAAALADGARVTAAVRGSSAVGLVVSRHVDDAARSDILAVGVAPGDRRLGLGTAMLRTHVEGMRPGDVDLAASVTVAERDPYDPLDVGERTAIARRLFERAGFDVSEATGEVRSVDRTAIDAQRPALRG